jgi:hypothetical protein
MNPKSSPNRSLYMKILRRMTPEQRLGKAFELTEMSRALFVEGLRAKFPNLTEKAFQTLVLRRLEKCHNRNY